MKNGILITGTDTGVGKTFVGAGIASALRRRGVDVGVMKPAETGCPERQGTLVPRDAVALMRAARADDGLDLVNPYRFREPLAPAVAAARAGRAIDVRRILSSFRAIAARHEFVIVEGAGGILVPLTARRNFLDLAAALGLPVVIVSRPGLGTINHTLLTVMALKHRRLPIAGIVINDGRGSGRPGIAERTSPPVIEQRSGVPIIGVVRHDQKEFTLLAKKLLGRH